MIGNLNGRFPKHSDDSMMMIFLIEHGCALEVFVTFQRSVEELSVITILQMQGLSTLVNSPSA